MKQLLVAVGLPFLLLIALLGGIWGYMHFESSPQQLSAAGYRDGMTFNLTSSDAITIIPTTLGDALSTGLSVRIRFEDESICRYYGSDGCNSPHPYLIYVFYKGSQDQIRAFSDQIMQRELERRTREFTGP